ncbi:unnamed protein product [Arabis nemorensis]|uniref:Uncharacterized protein n=1 Tax=Arabis nemorensis TaxID=586526 RepID=A0A565BZZ2_9BRAS|nr:unnamed protein product [Arabis nemorensis]
MGFKKKLMEQSKKKEENMGNTSASAVGTVNRIDLEKKKIIQQEKRHMEEPSHSAADKFSETNKMDKEEMMRTLKLKYDEAKKQLLILERLIPKILNSERKKTLHQYVDLMNKSMELRGRVIGKYEEEDFPRLLDSLKNLKSTFLDRISDENKMITKDKRKK